MTTSREPPALAGLIASQACASHRRSRAYPAGLLDGSPEFDRFLKISARSSSLSTHSLLGGYRLNTPVPVPKMLRPQADTAKWARSTGNRSKGAVRHCVQG